jgi:hypothetical protein
VVGVVFYVLGGRTREDVATEPVAAAFGPPGEPDPAA